MAKKYKKLTIELTEKERVGLEKMVHGGVTKAMDLRRANVLLLADESANSVYRYAYEVLCASLKKLK